MDLSRLPGLLLLIFGFGFVIFWHELGHFLAAKWAGVQVEQFAVGFGQAAVAWRKGIGFRIGTTAKEYRRRVDEYIEGRKQTELQFKELVDEPTEAQIREAGAALGLGETEYRLNWIPLGGYVKMLGQDDLRPNAEQTDPRAYNMKPIGKRMVIVSAGVIMNIILAVIGFTILFGYGFTAPAPVVGAVLPGSPAQRAGFHVGDTIVSIDGKHQFDFTKVILSVALASDRDAVPVVVRHPDGSESTLTVLAQRRESDSKSFLALGISGASELVGLDPKKVDKEDRFDPAMMPATLGVVKPGDVITAIDGQPVPDPETDYYLLDRAVQSSYGKPIVLTIKGADGSTRTASVVPDVAPPFGDAPVSFLGMEPRAKVDLVQEGSVALNKLLPGDVILAITVAATNDTKSNPDYEEVRNLLNNAGQEGNAVIVTVLRDGKVVKAPAMTPNHRVGDRYVLGIGLTYDMAHPVIASVLQGSPADTAKIAVDTSTAAGSSAASIDGHPVDSWFEVDRLLKQHAADQPNEPVKVEVRSEQGSKTFTIPLNQAEVAAANSTLYELPLALREEDYVRRTHQPLQAVAWGVDETRDLIAQFYLTLKRMVQGSVPASGAMGPLGIIQAGWKFAYKGTDWLIWFLSMISANLAVVNFLPIPIVDGGLFTFLIIEKLQGRPLSPRTQAIAQVVGLALIVSVFLFVTYQDILRMF